MYRTVAGRNPDRVAQPWIGSAMHYAFSAAVGITYAAAVRRAMGLTPVSAPAWLERFSPEESGAKLLQVLRAVTDGRGQPRRRTSEPASPYSRSA